MTVRAPVARPVQQSGGVRLSISREKQTYHHFIATNGSGSGVGSWEDPWTLAQFLAGPGGLNVGEVTALRGPPGADLYEQSGSWTWSSSLNGSGGSVGQFDKKINLVAYKPDVKIGGLPTISSSGTANETTLRIDGTHLRIQGVRFRKNNTIRGNARGTALWLRGAFDNKPTGSGMILHCYIEDGANGIFTGNSAATDFQGGDWTVYGCVFLNNGEDDGPRNHAVYSRHQGAGRWQVIGNIIGLGLANSLMVYEEAVGVDAITNVDLWDNICYQAGILGTQTGNWWNMILGGGGAADGPARDCTIRRNILYHGTNDAETANLQLGSIGATNEHVIVEDNHIYGGQQDDICRINPFRTDGNPTLVFRRNHFYPGAERVVTLQAGDCSQWTWADNKYYVASSGLNRFVHGGVQRTLAGLVTNAGIGGTDSEVAVPTSDQVHVIPVNAYEPGRTHVFIVNWSGNETVTINLDGILSTGDRFRVYRIQDPHRPVIQGPAGTGGTGATWPNLYTYTYGQGWAYTVANESVIQEPIGTCPRSPTELIGYTPRVESLIIERVN